MKKVKMMIVVATVLVANVMNAATIADASLTPVSRTNIPASVRLTADTLKIENLNAKYVLLQYWAKKAEGSLKKCIEMDNTVRSLRNKNVEMVMVSFDPGYFADSETVNSEINLSSNVTNYLLDENGAIVARNITPDELAMYIKTTK